MKKMNKKILILSDLHLESSNMKLNDIEQDIIVLAGDICVEKEMIVDFIYRNIPEEKPIVFVLGNHEYEGRIVSQVVPQLNKLFTEELPNHQIHVLDNKSVVIDGIKFIGSTLWSNFECFGIDAKKDIMDLADKLIIKGHHMYEENPYFGQGSHPRYLEVNSKKVEQWCQEAIDFIDYSLKEEFLGPRIVVTHFAPHKKSISEEYMKKSNSAEDKMYNMLSAFWVNSLDNLMGFSDYWIHGHVHHSFDYQVEGTRVISNPRGNSLFFDMPGNTSFDKSKTIEVELPLYSLNQSSHKTLKP